MRYKPLYKEHSDDELEEILNYFSSKGNDFTINQSVNSQLFPNIQIPKFIV